MRYGAKAPRWITERNLRGEHGVSCHRALIACAVFVAGRSTVVGPSAADAAQPKLDNGIGTAGRAVEPELRSRDQGDQDPVDRTGAVREGRPAAENGGKHRARRTKDSVKVVIVVEEDPTKPPTTQGGIGIAGSNQATGGDGNAGRQRE